jgi:hypothetical protein
MKADNYVKKIDTLAQLGLWQSLKCGSLREDLALFQL